MKLENKLPAIEKKMRRLGMLKDNTNANLKGTVFFRIKGKIHEEDPDVCVALQQKGHNRVSIKKTSKAKELSCKCHKTC